ncbi:hypothetical protein D3C78_1249880 [compost metagenome]
MNFNDFAALRFDGQIETLRMAAEFFDGFFKLACGCRFQPAAKGQKIVIRLRHTGFCRQLSQKFGALIRAVPDDDAAALVGNQRLVFRDLVVGLGKRLTVFAALRLDIAALPHQPDNGKQRCRKHADEKRIGDCFSG